MKILVHFPTLPAYTDEAYRNLWEDSEGMRKWLIRALSADEPLEVTLTHADEPEATINVTVTQSGEGRV